MAREDGHVIPARVPLIVDDDDDASARTMIASRTGTGRRATSAVAGRGRREGDAARPASTTGHRQSLASRNGTAALADPWAATKVVGVSSGSTLRRKENSAREVARLRLQREREAGFDTSGVIMDTSRTISKVEVMGKSGPRPRVSSRGSVSLSSSATASPTRAGGRNGVGARRSSSARAKHGSDADVRSLEERLAMSQNIMRKLYHRNVELEKEVQIARAEQAEAARDVGTSAPTSVLSSSFEERGRTIESLREANATLQKRVSSLESALGKTGASSKRLIQMRQSLREAAAQSVMYADQSRKIRNDYRRLLKRRADNFTQSKAAMASAAAAPAATTDSTTRVSSTACASSPFDGAAGTKIPPPTSSVVQQSSSSSTSLVASLRSQLDKEVRERETEAAVLSSKLYEFEKKQSDIYVERRLLTKKIEDMQAQIDDRDRVDREIEQCVCSLMDKTRHMEELNKKLVAKIDALQAGRTGPDDDPHKFSSIKN